MANHSLPRPPRRGHTRLRAVLAGGLVLGVGAIMTLAAWTDTEYTTGSFGTSTFDTVSSVDTSTFADHATVGTASSLVFSASAMSPGVLFYAPLDIKTTAGTNVAGTVVLTAVSSTGALAPALEYRMVRTTTATTCAAGAFASGTYIVGASTPTYALVTTAAPSGGSAISSAIVAAGASAIRYCTEIRVAPGSASSYQNKTSDVTWTFTATSNS